uniref:Probable imidazolonepropionase n=2 Tax=Hirondellea gigas TaxID=1518452 RepID=A0A6A7FP25_9CRUS
MAGASYMEVQKAGGGIHYTVAKTKEASEEELLDLLQDRLDRMLRAGTTLAEVKSGYGLTTEGELKLLRVLHQGASRTPITLVPTFLGAHAVPPGLEPEAATRLVIEEQLPAVVAARNRGEISVSCVDVFCEAGVFSVDQTKRIVAEARKLGDLMVNVHVDELAKLDGAKMAGELQAEAASHCEEVSAAGISAMRTGGTVAVLLPTTQMLLRLPAPPARDMIKQGVIVALGSDFNPNAFCLSMATVLHLACVLLRLSPAEALTAATLNAAHSVRRSHLHGALQPGMRADMLLIQAPRWEHLVYQLGEHHHLIHHVVCSGRVVYTKKE